jgi:thiamine pyrophosphokinase
LYEATVANQSISTREKTRFLPDLITGDLDSLLPHVREFYEGRGVPVVQIIDQDYHDLDVSIQSAVFVVLLRYHSFVLVCARNR